MTQQTEVKITTDGPCRTGFADRIQYLVDAAGSISALARLAGLQPGTVKLYLSGSEPTRRYLLAIADGAGCSALWLMTGRGATPDPKKLSVGMAKRGARSEIDRAARRGEELRGRLMQAG